MGVIVNLRVKPFSLNIYNYATWLKGHLGISWPSQKGDKIEILGYGKKYSAVINGMETYLKTLENLEPGDNAGILVKGR